MNHKNESSPLQLEFDFEASSDKAIGPVDKFEHFDNLSLKVMVYELEKKGLPEDEAFIEAARQELKRRGTTPL